MTTKILDFLRQLFGMRPSWDPPPQPDVVDDPTYDVEHVTDDDDAEREPIDEEPDPEVVEEIEREIAPLDTWLERQIALDQLGFYPGRADGKFGRRTQAAVRAFQQAHGLVADGIWGPKTEAAVTKALGIIQPPPLLVTQPPAPYENFIDPHEYVLDAEFFKSFVDVTAISNVENARGQRRRRGTRPFSNLTTNVWHQAGFTWRPYLELKAEKRYSGYHKINADGCIDTAGTIVLIHPFASYLMTANHLNPRCLSWEIMGNFEGEFGTGNWYKPDKFGRSRPMRIQLIRARQLTLWLLDPEQGPLDMDLPMPLLEWRLGCREHGNPLKYVNAHKNGTDTRVLDCGSESWYHVGEWSAASTRLEIGPVVGNGMALPDTWRRPPIAPPPAL